MKPATSAAAPTSFPTDSRRVGTAAFRQPKLRPLEEESDESGKLPIIRNAFMLPSGMNYGCRNGSHAEVGSVLVFPTQRGFSASSGRDSAHLLLGILRSPVTCGGGRKVKFIRLPIGHRRRKADGESRVMMAGN